MTGWTYQLARGATALSLSAMTLRGNRLTEQVSQILYAGANPVMYGDSSGHDFTLSGSRALGLSEHLEVATTNAPQKSRKQDWICWHFNISSIASNWLLIAMSEAREAVDFSTGAPPDAEIFRSIGAAGGFAPACSGLQAKVFSLNIRLT